MSRKILSAIVLSCLLVSGAALASSDTTTSGDPGILACPTETSPGNTTDFAVYYWTDMFVVQRASSGVIVVEVYFNTGSPAANVRLKNVATGATTTAVRLDSSQTSTPFNVGCGDWIVQIESAASWGSKTHGSITAYPL